MKNSTMLRLVILSAALTLGLGVAACDGNNTKIKAANNTNTEEASPDSGKEEANEPDTTSADADDPGHGKEPGEYELLEPGFMNGSWRAGALEQDRPVAYFDTFQDEGDPEITGTFVMGNALYDGGIDAESGELAEGSFDGGTLTIKWNPTTDPEEMFTLVASQTDENLLEGTITAERNVELDYPVKITRQLDE